MIYINITRHHINYIRACDFSVSIKKTIVFLSCIISSAHSLIDSALMCVVV